jgi:hypothetical protein
MPTVNYREANYAPRTLQRTLFDSVEGKGGALVAHTRGPGGTGNLLHDPGRPCHSCEGVEDVCRYDRLTRVKRAKGVPRTNNLHQAAQQACLLKTKTCGEFWGNEDAKFRTASALVCSHDAVIGPLQMECAV